MTIPFSIALAHHSHEWARVRTVPSHVHGILLPRRWHQIRGVVVARIAVLMRDVQSWIS
jgi:hypothetical protein